MIRKPGLLNMVDIPSSNEAEFIEHPLSYLNEKSIAGMPMLMDYGNNCWVAITEAKIDNYAAFYIGTNGNQNQLTTKLVPVPGEPETGVKVRFDDESLYSLACADDWRNPRNSY